MSDFIQSLEKVTAAFKTYWWFAAERHSIYLKRLRREPPPWTDDPALNKYKFTNAFRVCDRVSQYLIREVIYNPLASGDAEEVVFRILLYKFFNRISTWELFKTQFGMPAWKDFDGKAYIGVLGRAVAKGTKIFSDAYAHNAPGRTGSKESEEAENEPGAGTETAGVERRSVPHAVGENGTGGPSARPGAGGDEPG